MFLPHSLAVSLLFVSAVGSAQSSTTTLPAPPTTSAPPAESSTPPAARSNYTDPSSGESRPIFDWSKHKGKTEVPHPFAEKGLTEITKNKEYLYKVPESKRTRALSIHIGMFNPTNLRNPDGNGTAADTFAENYNETSSPAIFVDYEWKLMNIGLGYINIIAGGGVFVAQGNGHFENPDLNPGIEKPEETFTFAAFPIVAGGIYRLELWDKQLIVPHASGGGMLIPFTEIRDDHRGPKFGGSAAAYFAAGAGFNLTYFDRFSVMRLDREYGITRVYLTGEFRQIVAISKRYDFGAQFINFGFTMEF